MNTFRHIHDTGRTSPWSPHDDSDYVGRASIIVKGMEVPVNLELTSHREPIDGKYRWIGRIAANDRLSAIVGDVRRIRVVVATPHSAREAYLGDPDFWGRFRITGKSTPPFAVDTSID